MGNKLDAYSLKVDVVTHKFKIDFEDSIDSFSNGPESSEYCAKGTNALDKSIQNMEEELFNQQEKYINFFNLQNIRLKALQEYNSHCNYITSQKFK